MMYFSQKQVRALIETIIARLPGVEIMFDTIPCWFSRKTISGYWRTPFYRVPPMPWGINVWDAPALMKSWSPQITQVDVIPYRRFRTFPAALAPWLARLPGLRKHMPGNVRIHTCKSL